MYLSWALNWLDRIQMELKLNNWINLLKISFTLPVLDGGSVWILENENGIGSAGGSDIFVKNGLLNGAKSCIDCGKKGTGGLDGDMNGCINICIGGKK